MTKIAQKNRRYRNAKISEYLFKKIVLGFALEQTIGQTARDTRLSETAVSGLYWRLREHLRRYPIFDFSGLKRDEPITPMKILFDRVHRGGATPEQNELIEIERITRIIMGQKFRYVERLSASDPKQLDKARRIYKRNEQARVYTLTELLKPGAPDETAPENMRPFEPGDCKLTSVILINERQPNPGHAFFRYLWELLLRFPLGSDANK
jgi:hypothetical protein